MKNNFEEYLAKDNNVTIKEHNDGLLNILYKLKNIHDIDDETYDKLKIICKYHDIGKCIDEFQNNITSTRRSIRHEYLSASLDFLDEKSRLAILLHHKNLEFFKKYLNNEKYREFLEEMNDKLEENFINIEDFMKNIFKIRKQKILKDKELIELLGMLKICDYTASANIKDIDTGICFRDIYNFDSYKSIQKKVLELTEKHDILIKASTGCGKTETSLFYSDTVQNADRSKRIFYILPFTSSINFLYRRLKSENISVGVLHSKVRALLSKEDDIEYKEEELQLFKKNTKQVTICTIFQIIKSSFHCKNYEMLLCQFKNSIFIVDEIHCFEEKELALLLNTLKYLKKEYGIRICVMTASLSSCYEDLIVKELGISKKIISEREDYLTRHKLIYKNKTMIDEYDSICKDIELGKKVLICVNSVQSSQDIYRMLKSKYNNKKIGLIHARFNDRDRAKKEAEGLDECDILIGTQAIEVSLDIDYDKGYMEIAPFDSLIQRFGRVNRKGKKGIADIVIVEECNKSVYQEDIIDKTRKVILEIIEQDCSIVKEYKIDYYLNKIYTNINEAEYNKYSEVVNSLVDKLKVGYYDNKLSESIIDYNTKTVLSSCLLKEYRKLIEDRKFIQAGELLVNCFVGYNDDIYYDEELKVNIINCHYDSEIGLDKKIYKA